MILTENIDIRISNSNINHYITLGYECKVKQIINVKISELTDGCEKIVKVKCDVCGNEKEISYKSYKRGFNNGGFYCCCSSCAQIKNKMTNKNRYGDENYNNPTKSKKTCFEKYGDVNFTNRKKYKETCLDKYGVENPFILNEIKEKIKETNIEKYGVESHNSSEIVKDKKKQTLLEKYGFEHYSKTDEFKNIAKNKFVNIEKTKLTCIEKYGYKSSSQNEEIKNKIIQSNRETSKIKLLEKFKKFGIIDIDFDTKEYIGVCEHGHEYRISYTCFKTRRIYNNVLCTVCNQVKQFTKKENKTEFEIYKAKVNNITNRNKKLLFENWNGIDFYDNTYIRDNVSLGKNHNDYPSVDHMISILNGFKNNISVDIIGSLDNLCITTRKNNMKKSTKNYDGFRL